MQALTAWLFRCFQKNILTSRSLDGCVFLFLSEMSVNKSTLCSWNAEGMADDCTHIDGYKNVHAEEVEEETRRSPYGSPLPLIRRGNRLTRSAWSGLFQCALARPEGLGMEGQSVLVVFNHSVCFPAGPRRPAPADSERQERGWVEGVGGLVAAAAAAPVGFGAGLRRGRGALGLHHVGIGEYEVLGVWRGCRGGRHHHRRIEAVSVRAVHPTADAAASQADGLNDRALRLAHILLYVLGLLLHHHLVHLCTRVQAGAHGELQRVALLLLLVVVAGLLMALVDGQLAHGVVGDQHEL